MIRQNTTTIVEPGNTVRMDKLGNLIVEVPIERTT